MWISQSGFRFINEGIVNEWTIHQNAIYRVGGIFYTVFDHNSLLELRDKGALLPYSDWVPTTTKLDKIEEAVIEGEKLGYVFKANSLKELAVKIGVNEANLRKTVDEINKFTTYNVDEVFGKDKRFLRRVEKGPFYAIKGEPSFMSTTGGIRVNSNMQAVNAHDMPIEGLYAAGIDVGGQFGDTYDLTMGGTLSSYAATGGRIAAEHIAVKLGKK